MFVLWSRKANARGLGNLPNERAPKPVWLLDTQLAGGALSAQSNQCKVEIKASHITSGKTGVESFAMDEPQIYAQLAKLFEDVFDDDSISVTPELSAKDVDGWDSLTHIRLLLSIEKAFKIKFTTSEIGSLKNVGDLVALIKERA